MRVKTQGAQANASGRYAEDIIDSTLRLRGHVPERQVGVGTGIFGTELRVDFYLARFPGFATGLIVESKWQDTPGSADEKLCYLVENIRTCYPCPAVIVAGGKGARPGAIRWLRLQVDHAKLYAVYNLEEFVTWCNRISSI